jgi:hypothetical protein
LTFPKHAIVDLEVEPAIIKPKFTRPKWAIKHEDLMVEKQMDRTNIATLFKATNKEQYVSMVTKKKPTKTKINK